MNAHGATRLTPLIRYSQPTAPIAYRGGVKVDAARFLGDVRALAASLPERKYVVNRISDRYYFAVGFAAALMRKQVTLLPPNETPEMMRQLSEKYPETYCLTDTMNAGDAMPQHLCFVDHLAPAAYFSVPAIDEKQIAALIFTSGSTGEPIPHPRSWGALTRSVKRSATGMGLTGLEGAAILATVSPQHSYGLESSVMLALQQGLALTPTQAFYPADIALQLEELPRPRILVTTPVHLRFLTADAAALPQADMVISATAPLSDDLAARAEAVFGCPLLEIYGCTEAGQISWRRTTRQTQWRCFSGIVLSQEAEGTWASGYQIDHKTLLNDVLELHGKEEFSLHGRHADVVNIAGKRTSLAYLNHQLGAINGVVDGAFVLPDDAKEAVARLAAMVVAPTLTSHAVMTALRQRLDPVFLPRPLIMLDRIPRNANGKLTRREVDLLLAEQLPARAPARAEIVFEQDEPFFAGHFPSNPIVPGAMLLQEILRLLQDAAALPTDCEIRAAKFLRPVRPADRVEIRWMRDGHGDFAFDCFIANEKVLTGTVGGLAASA